MFVICVGSIALTLLNYCVISPLEICIALPAQDIPVDVGGKEVPPTELSDKQLYHLARSITVQVLSGNQWGSGILIQKQGEVYTVLTNEHVLMPNNEKSYRIQTPDGQIYPAYVQKSVNFNENDLGLLQFRSPNSTYVVASLGTSSPLAVGDKVFSAGFPPEANASKSRGFVLTTGQIGLLMNRAFVGGYQNGYTNKVEPGMSGGPLLNRRGEVVGINGKSKYPLWGNPYVFQDGSLPPESMQEQMTHYSWAIPIETFLQLVPSLSSQNTAKPVIVVNPTSF